MWEFEDLKMITLAVTNPYFEITIMNRLVCLFLPCLLFSSCTNKIPFQFDKIILSTSSCMMECPMSNIILNADGTVIFKGQGAITKKGLFTGKVAPKYLETLQSQFEKINFDSLKNKYESPVTDLQTVSVTFIKNGKIYKTVNDYGRTAPAFLKSSYASLENLYQNIPLKKIPDPAFIPSFEGITNSKIKKEGKVLDLTQSETFLLFNYLRNGRISHSKFKTRFKLHTNYDAINPLYDIDTDGRYFTFNVNGKPLTIDIGFNFYDVNAKNWVWRKADEYD